MTARIVITTFGSYGDVNPYIGLARALEDRGHRPVIATAEYYRTAVERGGIEFRPIGPDADPTDTELLRKVMDPKRGSEFILRDLIIPRVRESLEELRHVARDAELLVTHPLTFAAGILAEERRLPWVSTVLAPISFFSPHDLPVFPPAPWLHAFGTPRGLPARWLAGLARTATRSWATPIHRLREELGLRDRGDPIFEGQHSPDCVLALFSPLLAARQPDWPPHTVVTGHLFYDGGPESAPLDTELESFLAGGAPPVVFTLGTSAVSAAGQFYEESLRAARALGVRAVLLIGKNPANRPAADPGPDVVVRESAPYSALFPRASVIVHQGGIGTTAQALRAGRPMLVVPFAHDQPDNAYRVQRLGVARTVYPHRYAAARVIPEIQALLGEPAYAQAAMRVAARIGTENGASAACDAIERTLRKPGSGPHRLLIRSA